MTEQQSNSSQSAVIWTLTEDDCEWDFENDGKHEMVFETEGALALFLINGVVFLNSNWYQKDWPEDAQKRTSVLVNCNDIFAWACADAEPLPYSQIETLYRMFRKDPAEGAAVWCCIQRKEMPQAPVAKDIRKAGIWDLDSLNLVPNHYDEQCKEWARDKASNSC